MLSRNSYSLILWYTYHSHSTLKTQQKSIKRNIHTKFSAFFTEISLTVIGYKDNLELTVSILIPFGDNWGGMRVMEVVGLHMDCRFHDNWHDEWGDVKCKRSHLFYIHFSLKFFADFRKEQKGYVYHMWQFSKAVIIEIWMVWLTGVGFA